jgi:Flp pilus assembly pilin Flp
MTRILTVLAAWREDRRAVTALEYGIIISVLAIVFIFSFGHLATPLSEIFSEVGNSL